MERIAFFDTKPYDRIYFDKLNRDFELVYFESLLRAAAQSARSSTTTSEPQPCAPSRTSVWR